MNKEEIVSKTIEYVKGKLSGESSGHDWWHVYRVWKNGKHIAEVEKANLFIVELASLLHDIADWKFNKGDENIGSKISREWLESLKVDRNVINKVCEIVAKGSFKKGMGIKNLNTLEGEIVQDADRLDAIGAIGIARAFTTGAKLGEIMYSKDTKEAENGTVIDHFYEKLLLLKDQMNTNTAKKMAEEKHKFTELFLKKFLTEWED